MPLLLLSAWILLLPASAAPSRWFPGDPSYPDLSCTVNYFWLLSQRGWLGATHSRLLMYPNVADFVLLAGFQLDALVARPFVGIFGLTAGFTLFQVTALWLAGVSAAWLAGCWWRSPVAALIGGIVCQSSPVLVRELAYGRPTQVFGIIFVPLALGLFARALLTQRQGPAFLSGLMLGFAALSYWFYGFFCGLGMASLWILSLVERRWAFRSIFACAAGTSLVAGLPIAYTLVGQSPMAAMDTTLWDTVVHGGHSMVLAQLLEDRDLGSLALSEGLLGITPFVVILGVAGAWGNRARRWVAPTLWLMLATLIAAGPIIDLPGSVPLPGPFAVLAKLPVVRRLWWPDRAMMLAVPAMSVLAAGGALRLLEHLPARWPRPLLAAACGAALLVEAFLGLRNLPLPVTSGLPSKGALALAKGHGPLLVLPGMSGRVHRDPQMLLDQVWHGRPLVNGPMPPDSATAPGPYREVSRLPVMAALYGCGQGMTPRAELSPELVLDRLGSMGLTEVAVDMAAIGSGSGQGATYLSCIETLLGQTFTQRSPYRVYATVRSAP